MPSWRRASEAVHTLVRRVWAIGLRFVRTIADPRISRRRRALTLVRGLAVVAGLTVGLVLLYGILLIPFTPGIGQLQKTKQERPTILLSSDGSTLAELKPLHREWVSLEEVAPEVLAALIATEDHRFHGHPGVDVWRIFGAALHTITGNPQGGSTITQQLARNLYPDEIGRKLTLTRKLKETITAFKIEYAFTKEEILETYLNTVPFLYNAYGIEMAARTYYGKSAGELSLLESATLVGMLKGVYYYNPALNPERARERRNVVLRQMVKRGELEESRMEELRDEPLRLAFSRQEREPGPAPHYVDRVRAWLVDWADRRGYNVYRDSLVVRTTLDLGMQELAQRAVDRWLSALQAVAAYEWDRAEPVRVSTSPEGYRYAVAHGNGFGYLWSSRASLVQAFVRQTPQFRAAVAEGVDEEVMLDSLMADAKFMTALQEMKTRLEAGFVALDPATGEIRAWVGSRDYRKDQYDHVSRARRQAGSTFKPFVYAAALEEGFRTVDELPDEPIEIELKGGEVWSPRNAGGFSGRNVSLADGLAYSKNTITAQLVQEVGTRDVARLARRMGVRESRLDEVPSIALGTSSVSLLEMTAAYATFASGGVYRAPVMVSRIEDRHGRVVYDANPRGRRAISEETAYRVVDMMRQAVDRGTGTRIRTTFGIRADVAGKTGTTQNNVDGWFILMHPRLVAGAWVGFNDPRVAFRSEYWGRGGNNAVFVVGDFFRRLLSERGTEFRNPRFPDPPPYEDLPRSWIARSAYWIRNVAVAVGSWVGSIIESAADAIFGGGEEEQLPTPVRRASGSLAEGTEADDGTAVADSLTRMARDSTQLSSILSQIRGEDSDNSSGAAGAPAPDESEPPAEDADGEQVPPATEEERSPRGPPEEADAPEDSGPAQDASGSPEGAS